MKNLNMYPTIWQSIPFSLDMMDQWDEKGKRIEDLILENEGLTQQRVTEMVLDVSKLSVLKDNGKEHFITKFTGNKALNLKGVHTGLFIKTKEVLELEPGNYVAFRFYIKAESSYVFFNTRTWREISGGAYIDFKIQNGLVLYGNESKQIILRFNFEPYTLSSYFKPLWNVFKSSKSIKHRLAHSLGL